MKKSRLSLAAIIGLVFTSVTFAAAPTNGYVSSQHPGTSASPVAALFALPTEIAIINYSDYVIHAAIPGILDQVIDAHATGNIKNSKHGGRTQVVIHDAAHNPLFGDFFCPYAILKVDYNYGRGMFEMNAINNVC